MLSLALHLAKFKKLQRDQHSTFLFFFHVLKHYQYTCDHVCSTEFAIDDAKLTFLTSEKKNKNCKNSSLICSSVFKLTKTDPRERKILKIAMTSEVPMETK